MRSVTTEQTTSISAEQKAFYTEHGYLIARGMFSPDQVAAIRDTFEAIGSGPAIPPYWQPKDDPQRPGDPLTRYPRVMHPHRFNALARDMLLHPGVGAALRQLLGAEPVACQSMYYFKPPGARGQAMHQDNFYLEVAPQTCIAAWTAIDPATPENGGLYVVPGTHKLDIICPDTADLKESFTTHLVHVPKGMKAVAAEMQPGDTLFFNGSVIHGSGPNRHKTLWRRSFICHYMPRESTQISKWYFPILDFSGNEIPYPASVGGGPCGMEEKPTSYDRVH